MSEFTTKWFKCSEGVLGEHESIEVRQRYCFIFTNDKKIVIVSKDDSEWQFPGGHPDNNEDWKSTLKREVWEETGISIDNLLENVVKLGYYLVKFPTENFLQERYLLCLDNVSEDLSLVPHEDEEDSTPIIKYVKAVDVDDIGKYIPWAVEVEGWKAAFDFYIKANKK